MNPAITNENLLMKWFRGDIKLWKAVFLLQIMGTYSLLLALESLRPFIAEPALTTLKMVALPVFAVYASICVFRASPHFKTTIRGTLGKCWAVSFAAWSIWIAYALFSFQLVQ
ncbi:hypothetical protein [Vibrio sonorensis]|uniref:hypothetical protein n=1 Tax=Vibrio sonorensis TaxID=1004316 RepID=UPI0008D9D58F|nr:hypothetical protein [Vibrio sonorensis]